MNVIILARDDASVLRPEVGAFTIVGRDVATGIERLLEHVTTGTWRIARTDRWQYDERVISALHTVRARSGVELIDPTGLLGGTRYGTERNLLDTTPVPLGAGSDGVKIRAMRERRRKQRRAATLNPRGDGEDRTWR